MMWKRPTFFLDLANLQGTILSRLNMESTEVTAQMLLAKTIDQIGMEQQPIVHMNLDSVT